MAGQLKISTSTVHTDGVAFQCNVEITGAQVDDTVTIRLWQTAGVKPFYNGTAQTVIDANQHGWVTFTDVVLHGAGSVARLVADDDESSTPLSADEIHIDVVKP